MLSDIIRSGLVESYMLKTIWTQETAFALRTNKTFEQSETRVKICDSAEFWILLSILFGDVHKVRQSTAYMCSIMPVGIIGKDTIVSAQGAFF